MSISKLSNISLRKYRQFLKKVGCSKIRTNSGHEHWAKNDLDRPITIQTHISPVPEFIIKQHLRYLKLSRKDFFKIIQNL